MATTTKVTSPAGKKIGKVSKRTFKGPNGKQFRVNSWKAFLAIVLGLACRYATILNDRYPTLYSGWSLFGLVLLVIVTLFFLAFVYLHGHADTRRWWVSFGLVTLGFVIAITIKILQILGVDAKALAIGVGTFLIIGGSFIGIAVTDWWRPKHRAK